MRNLEEITEILRHHPWSREAVVEGFRPVLAELGVDPAERAKILVEDMASIGCEWPIRSEVINDKLILSHDVIPESDFGQIEREDVPEALTAHGTGLNLGSVIRLSKVCEVGRRFFRSDWPGKFKDKLLNKRDHLSFVEEVLWLNLWHGVSDIESEAQPFRDRNVEKRVDWRFRSCGMTVNLEVKSRPKDWMRRVDGPENNLVMPSYFYDVPQKFPAKNENELNLVAVSTPAAIDRSLRERIEILLRTYPNIDGALIWAQESRSAVSPFEIHAIENKDLISTLFTGGDFEDAAHIGIIRHVWRKRDERRAYRADEVPELLSQLSKDVDNARRG